MNSFGESVDKWGIPIHEINASEVEVKFLHNGKKAVAKFDVWGSEVPSLVGHGTDLIGDGVKFIGAEYEESGETIPKSDLESVMSSLEDQAIENGRSLTESVDSDVVRSHLDRARKEVKKAIDFVRGLEGSFEPKSNAAVKIRSTKMSLIDVEQVLVHALSRTEAMIDKIKRS